MFILLFRLILFYLILFITYRSGQIQNALKHIKQCLKYTFSNIDKAIVFNNISRLYLCANDYSLALKFNKICLEVILSESNIILKDRLSKSDNNNLSIELKNKAELISFLFYNNAYLLEKLKNEDESYYIYQKGMQFSTSILGDLNMLSNKFRPKLSYAKIPKNINNIQIYNDNKFINIDDTSLIDVNSLAPSHNLFMGKMGFQKKVLNKNKSSKNNKVIFFFKFVYKFFLFFFRKFFLIMNMLKKKFPFLILIIILSIMKTIITIKRR